jgi:FAD/FMN-containing dehydrogenase
VVVARPDNEHADLFHAFPNSYGTLGYSLRLQIDLEPVKPYVRLRHLRFETAEECLGWMARACADRVHDGEPVDFVDGTVFSPSEQYATIGTFVDTAPWVSDYTGMGIYYRSLQGRDEDYLTVRDYLALGHRLVLVLACLRGATADGAPVLAAPLPTLRCVQTPRRL